MKEKNKSYLYFDEKDRKRFRMWLIQEGLDQDDIAKRLNISASYFCLILSGKRALTDKVIDGLRKLGYNVVF